MNRFTPNPLRHEQLKRDPFFRHGVALLAREVEGHAKANATGFKRSVQYLASIYSDQDEERTVVGSTDFAAVVIEFGSRNNPAYAPMRRTVMQAGLRYDGSRK